MSAGTNDGRVLFWNVNNTQYMQINIKGYVIIFVIGRIKPTKQKQSK
jgi:hypothetical protein